jgi:predicted HTH domain antitoxin
MAVTIEIPASIEQQLQTEWGDLARRALEVFAVESYRAEVLTRGQVGELLGLNFWETEAFLKERGAYLHYTLEGLEQDRATNRRVLNR